MFHVCAPVLISTLVFQLCCQSLTSKALFQIPTPHTHTNVCVASKYVSQICFTYQCQSVTIERKLHNLRSTYHFHLGVPSLCFKCVFRESAETLRSKGDSRFALQICFPRHLPKCVFQVSRLISLYAQDFQI